LVVPMIDGDRLLGVFDLDSPRPNRFDAAKQALKPPQLLMLTSRGNV
jgi:putative methionine-R-sulfoxide reductase with GAF domain